MDDDRTVTRQADFDVPADEVWDAIARDDDRAAWWGGDTELDLVPGGAGHATDEEGERRTVRVADVEPGRRLTFDWWTDDDRSRVELVVLPRPGGSRLVVTETRLGASSVQACAGAVGGRGRGSATGTLGVRLLDLELLLLVRHHVLVGG